MIKNKLVIAITGNKGAGKDTIASMLEYIMTVGVQKATYNEWFRQYNIAENFKGNIVHFADKLKTLCAEITNLPIHYFNNAQYKDNWWWIYGTQNFIGDDVIDHKIAVENTKEYYRITLSNISIAEELKNAKKEKKIPVIKLRSILQFVGTEMFRELYDEDYFINITISKIKEICDEKEFCIIPDLRFNNEYSILNKKLNNTTIKLIVISVGETDEFEKNRNERSIHLSERQLKTFDYYFCNKKDSLMKLFVNVLQFYQKQLISEICI